MSKVDTKFPAAERADLIEEIKGYLPAFLSRGAIEQQDTIGDVEELLNLRRDDLRRVVAVHVVLSDPVSSFVDGLRVGLRKPFMSSERELVVTQAVCGPVDWQATIRARAASGWSPTSYAVRPARRIFDTPENRAVVWIMDRIDAELRRTSMADSDPAGGVYSRSWFGRIAWMRGQIQNARTRYWLRGLRGERPDQQVLKGLKATRKSFYGRLALDAFGTLQRYTERDISTADLTALLCERYFEPERDWRLFELVVTLRLARALADVCSKRHRERLLLGKGRAPFARYEMPDGDEVRLWYQAWPRDGGASVHGEASAYYEINAASSRPDIVVQRLRNGALVDSVLLELKASRTAGTLGAGLLQLLGYLKDRPAPYASTPRGWLVAPPSDSFVSKDPSQRELWVVDSDNVAAAVLERLSRDS